MRKDLFGIIIIVIIYLLFKVIASWGLSEENEVKVDDSNNEISNLELADESHLVQEDKENDKRNQEIKDEESEYNNMLTKLEVIHNNFMDIIIYDDKVQDAVNNYAYGLYGWEDLSQVLDDYLIKLANFKSEVKSISISNQIDEKDMKKVTRYTEQLLYTIELSEKEIILLEKSLYDGIGSEQWEANLQEGTKAIEDTFKEYDVIKQLRY